jgi:predicted PurR-regulated permease PerM
MVTIGFLTLFMLLEGPAWVERGLDALPESRRASWRRVGGRMRETVSGYVTGNLLISAIAGTGAGDRAPRPVPLTARGSALLTLA